MAIRAVLQHPDPRLREVAQPVASVTDAVRALADDLLQTMRYSGRDGIGLAAPQLGEPLRIFVMDEHLGHGKRRSYVCINPEIIQVSGATSLKEGCLSFPDGSTVRVARASAVTLTWLDRHGERRSRRFDGLCAVCVQHEIDHLDGKLMVDYGELETKPEAS